MDYKDTLNLPKTDFPMKGDLPQKEPLFLAQWKERGLYELLRNKSKDKPQYILHDGPPYANGNIHIGHALNKTLKDIVVKFKTMRGMDSPYIPGWDCHGLPVEHQLFKELKIHKSQINQVDFRKKAHEYAMKYVGIQREEFKRLGILGDWENPYLTLNHDYEEGILNAFKVLTEKGFIYRGLKPVNWCCRCETALAEAEVEYEDHTSPSVFVKFKLDKNPSYPEGSFLVIWTTTPWTLVSNVAVAAHPDFVYSVLKTDKGILILASSRLDILPRCGIEHYEVLKEIKGRDLEGLTYAHPFGFRTGRVVLADYVSKEEGSGLVHTAPGHGNEDYHTGIKYKLDIVMPVDDKGNYDETAGEFKGLNVFNANEVIIQKLQEKQTLLLVDKIRHSYPHCWRCKNPVIFRATKQWFLNIDHNGFRQKLLGAIRDNVRWIPAVGKERISGMVQLRPDWCLSRQRYWGVPIPSLVCLKCKEELLHPDVIGAFAGFASREGTDSWFIRNVEDFITGAVVCPHCGGKDFKKGTDILDVWFDSGASNQSVLKTREGVHEFPCSLYLEGSDQHRGWFQASLIVAMGVDEKPPYKNVLTHGFVVDGEGRKMSKSIGNVISPFDIIKNYGADILRLWVASSDYNEDIRISKEILARLVEAYRKIRNTARFILSNLNDFNPDEDKIGYKSLKKIDTWILYRMNEALGAAQRSYEAFEFHKAYKTVYDFCNEDLSMFYLDMAKGRLYTAGKDSIERRAAQTALYEVLSAVVRMIAPMLVFTAEEIWQHFPKGEEEKTISSVHLLDWPEAEDVLSLEREGKPVSDLVFNVLPVITKALEEKRVSGIIGSSFDAKIKLLTNNEIRYKSLNSLRDDLCEIFKVSQVEIVRVEQLEAGTAASENCPDLAIEVAKAEGEKCQRCWNYSASVGANKAHSLICSKCLDIIGGNQ